MKPPKVGFTAAQVDALIQQPKTIPIAPSLRERAGFARLVSAVLVEETRDIGLQLEAHVGLHGLVPLPNAVLRWGNVRIRGIDNAPIHRNVPGLADVEGWHETSWDDIYGDRKIGGLTDTPPLGLRAFFEFAARLWNVRIVRSTGSLDLE